MTLMGGGAAEGYGQRCLPTRPIGKHSFLSLPSSLGTPRLLLTTLVANLPGQESAVDEAEPPKATVTRFAKVACSKTSRTA